MKSTLEGDDEDEDDDNSAKYARHSGIRSQLLSTLSELNTHIPSQEPDSPGNYQHHNATTSEMRECTVIQCTPAITLGSNAGTPLTDLISPGSISLIHGAKALTLSLLMIVSPPSMQMSYRAETASECEKILSIANALKHTDKEVIKILFPLKLVCVYSPIREQRVHSFELVNFWSRGKGMDGICESVMSFVTTTWEATK